MKPELRIGVVDSGHPAAQRVQVVAGRRFSLLEDGLAESGLRDDPLGHGSAVIEAIGRRAPSTYPGQSGASISCAALSGHMAGFLAAHPEASNDQVIDWLRENARYRGPERRFGP